jgi:hypothetical protein
MPKVGKSDKNLLRRSAGAIAESAVYAAADAAATTTPFIAPAWALSKALFGNAMQLREQRVFEFVESIIDDPKAFNEGLTGSEEFQDGFVVALEDYIKIRNHLKRRVAQKVFREFAVSDNKVDFQLERYNDTLRKISPESISLLGFIKKVIIPYREKYIREKMKGENLGTEKPYEWWLELKLSREPLSSSLSLWITEQYSPNGSNMKELYGEGDTKQVPQPKLSELFDLEKEQRRKYGAPIGELEYLGLVSKGISGTGGWGSVTSMTWTLSGFAYEFMKFIENSPEQLGENVFIPQETPKS